MQFSYRELRAHSLKELVKQATFHYQEAPDLDQIKYKDTFWEESLEPELDCSLKECKAQLDYLLNKHKSSLKSQELEVYQLAWRLKQDPRGSQKLAALIELVTGQRLEVDLSPIKREKLLKLQAESRQASLSSKALS